MAKIVIVAGSPGAGKTTLLNSVKNNYNIVNIGDIMAELAVAMKYTDNRDKIRFLSKHTIDTLRSSAFIRVKAMKGSVIVDTHASVEENGRYLPGLPHTVMQKLGSSLKALIYVDASTSEILERRRRDKSRSREIEPKEFIDIQRTINIACMASYSSDLNIPMYIIINRNGGLKKSSAEFSSHLKEIFS